MSMRVCAPPPPTCRWLTTHLEGDSRSGLEQLLGNQDPITIESTEYNWNLNKLWEKVVNREMEILGVSVCAGDCMCVI